MTPEHAADIPFSMGTRFAGEKGSNPEEVLGSAFAGCFSMALSLGLEKGGLTPKSIRTSASVSLDKDGEGFSITKIALETTVSADGDAAKIKAIADETLKQCPVGKVLKAEITLEVKAG